MTPKEKAEELVKKFTLSSNAQDGSWMWEDLAKQCALIAIHEIVQHINELDDSEWYFAKKQYLYDVKQEVEKLWKTLYKV